MDTNKQCWTIWLW